MPTIDLTDDELAAVTAAIRHLIDQDKFPRAPRLEPLRSALAEARPRDGGGANPAAAEAAAASPRRQAGAALAKPLPAGATRIARHFAAESTCRRHGQFGALSHEGVTGHTEGRRDRLGWRSAIISHAPRRFDAYTLRPWSNVPAIPNRQRRSGGRPTACGRADRARRAGRTGFENRDSETSREQSKRADCLARDAPPQVVRPALGASLVGCATC